MKVLVAALALAGLATAAQAAGVQIDNARIRASLGNVPTSAAYLMITNIGTADDTLLSASCACAAKVVLHRTTTDKGVSRMRTGGALAVPMGGMIMMDPGAEYHLMLTGVKKPIRAGDQVPMTLKFEKAGTITAVFKATGTPGGEAPAQHQH